MNAEIVYGDYMAIGMCIGFLFLGGAETTMNLDDGFERVQYGKASCYRLKR